MPNKITYNLKGFFALLLFFCNSDRDFYSENNSVSEVYTYIPKIQKKKQHYYRVYSN
jgi:hypothetical protein